MPSKSPSQNSAVAVEPSAASKRELRDAGISKASILEMLSVGQGVYERRLDRRILETLADQFLNWPGLRRPDHSGSHDVVVGRQLVSFLREEARNLLSKALALRTRHSDFLKRHSAAPTRAERQRHILELARDLGSSDRELARDRRAFDRWFGPDAITDRFERVRNGIERRLTVCLGRLGVLAERLLGETADGEGKLAVWRSLSLEEILKRFFVYDGDDRVRVAAFRCLSRALVALPENLQERSVDENTVSFIYRSAMHSRQNVWLQCEAIALLERIAPDSLAKVIEHRLIHPEGNDDIFVRRRVVRMLLRNLAREPRLADLVAKAVSDSAPFVRQGLAETLPEAPAEVACRCLNSLSLEDDSPQVRASALLAAVKLLVRRELHSEVAEVWKGVVRQEEDSFVLRVAMAVAVMGAEELAEKGSAYAAAWCEDVLQELEALHVDSPELSVRRWAAQARERVWLVHSPQACIVKNIISSSLEHTAAGRRATLPSSLLFPYPHDLVGRVVSALVQDDFGVDIELGRRGTKLTRGPVFGFRPWRLWHELLHPSPDKRQAFSHTVGRLFRGNLHAPSAILAELAETKVPGEPLFLAEESGWRPYLPLVDQMLSALRPGSAARRAAIYTSEGVTRIYAPRSPLKALRAWGCLTRRFSTYAELRNWREGRQDPPASYIEELSRLGFRVEFHPYRTDTGSTTLADSAVTRFFPALLPLFHSDFWMSVKEYFVSVYENSLPELAAFIGAACTLFAGRHLFLNASLRAARRRLPLVVGGWGTRGKSGTERLKAALFNALGYGVVSKTTGCEAMFLFAHPFGKLREMFLFRPYDKATIWEQHNLVRLAERLDCEVFLWECMALTPSYVEVLQQSWMRDDISTITNTYPDHEDLQGPAGFNIPEVMLKFIPSRSKLVTSEDQMLPILREGARERKTSLREVSWLECGLLTPDVLARFPYDEHPNNIALVLRLAQELGVERDFALKEMADRVVADLGVLKTYPTARVNERRLQLVNGMSANERHGCIGNWKRLGFDRHDPGAEPGVWITTVVNNRADRVPRSKVFAKILVEDISADRHFLIGTNLSGLTGYIHQAWEAHAPTIRLWPEKGDGRPGAVLESSARRMRVPTERELVVSRLRVMLSGTDLVEELDPNFEQFLERPEALREQVGTSIGAHLATDVIQRLREDVQLLAEYADFRTRVQSARSDERRAIEEEFQRLLWRWFQRKIVVIEDPHASGEQIIERIAKETPPGFLNRIMGMQNIKGTGLDFIYRWQAWDTCHAACADMRSEDPVRVHAGLKTLSSFQEYGLLSEEHVRETIDKVRSNPAAQKEGLQAELAVIKSILELAMQHVREKLQSDTSRAGGFTTTVQTIEGIVDAGDAVKRRKTANRIYKELAAGRIGLERAAYELQMLTKRQKGGWLLHTVRAAQNRLGRHLAALYSRAIK